MFKKVIILMAVISGHQVWAHPELDKIKREIINENIEILFQSISQIPAEKREEAVKKDMALIQEIKKIGVDAFIEKYEKDCQSNNVTLECGLCGAFSSMLAANKTAVLNALKEHKKVSQQELKELKVQHTKMKAELAKTNERIQKIEAI